VLNVYLTYYIDWWNIATNICRTKDIDVGEKRTVYPRMKAHLKQRTQLDRFSVFSLIQRPENERETTLLQYM